MTAIAAIVAFLGGWRATAFALLASVLVAVCLARGNALDAERSARAIALAQLAVADLRIDGFRALLRQINVASDEEIAAAKAQAKAGDVASAQAKAAAERLAAKLQDARARMQAAKAEPGCADQLRMTLCPAIPLL